MATPVTESSAPNDIELPPAVHWPTVYAMAGIGGGLVAVLAAVALIAAAQSPLAPQSPQPAASVAVVLPPTPHPLRTTKPAAPAETTPGDSGPPLWKPLVPHPAPVPAPAVQPLIRPPDLTAVLPADEGRPRPPAVSPLFDAALDPLEPPNSSFYAAVTKHDYEILEDLKTQTKEIDLNAVEGTSAKLLKAVADRKAQSTARPHPSNPSDAGAHPESVRELIALRIDLAGLPVRGESECTLSEDPAKNMEALSVQLRRSQVRLRRLEPGGLEARYPIDPIYAPANDRDKGLISFLSQQQDWLKDDNVPVLAQMLWAETPPVRIHLTEMLASIKGRKASIALARQALFDISPLVREAAIEALKDRPSEEYRQVLLDGFRHPWPSVADHAETALTALGERDIARPLAEMLDLPDPSAPTPDEKKGWVKAEIVKVNHLRNCLLCHAPSADPEDHVRGFIPKPGEAIPVEYYVRSKGDFVRADVTYLRQDFSIMESVADPGKWPSMQRFDYLVRRHPLTDQEMIDMVDGGPDAPHSYPQRDAVLRTLRGLTGEDAGESSVDWLDLLTQRDQAPRP